jgi:hypothetical protein
LTPIAVALVFVAWLGGSAATQPSASSSSATAETFETWTGSSAVAEPAAVFLQSSTGDVLLEAVLTGGTASAGDSDGR